MGILRLVELSELLGFDSIDHKLHFLFLTALPTVYSIQSSNVWTTSSSISSNWRTGRLTVWLPMTLRKLALNNLHMPPSMVSFSFCSDLCKLSHNSVIVLHQRVNIYGKIENLQEIAALALEGSTLARNDNDYRMLRLWWKQWNDWHLTVI